MSNTQFILYDSTIILIIAHFLDSAKDQEWNEPIYFGNYPFWLISSVLIITFTIIGIIPVYLGNNSGNWFSIIASIGGLATAGYHMPMHYFKKSETCNNSFSYGLMFILSISCLLLIYFSVKNMYTKDTTKKEEKLINSK